MAVDEVASGEALFAFDEKLLLTLWNEAAEELTGYTAEEVIGRPCWEVLRGLDADGARVCRPGCGYARLMKLGVPTNGPRLDIVAKDGTRRRVSLSLVTLTNGGSRRFLHVMRPEDGGPGLAPGAVPVPELTPRQRQVLELAGEGLNARKIAARLGLAETTARNHLAVLTFKLDCGTIAQAVQRARDLGLLPAPASRPPAA